MKKLEFRKYEIIWAVVFIAALILIILKCPYGFANVDESFYLTIPLRMCQGDGLLIHEWHLTQLVGFLLYPLMKLYLALSADTEGIALTFRYFYVAVQAIAAVFFYFRLRRISRNGAGMAAVCFMIFAPFGIMALSYNSLGITLLAASLVILLTMKRAVKVQSAVAGLLFAGAVLCCPYLVIVYAVYTIACVVMSIRKAGHQVFGIITWLLFTGGVAVIAAAFAVHVLSHGSISDIVRNLKYIMDDPDHESVGIAAKAVTYVKSIFGVNVFAKASYVLTFLTALMALLDKKRKSHGAFIYALGAVFCVAAVISIGLIEGSINFVIFPANLFAVICVIISWQEWTRKLFFMVWIPGMLYTFCIHLSSNQELYAISLASMVPLIGSILIIMLAGTEYAAAPGRKKTPAVTAVVLFVALQLVILGTLRVKTVFWENPNEFLAYPQTEGNEKGLYISKMAEDQYLHSLEIAEHIKEKYPETETAAFITCDSWLYLLMPEVRNGSYSAWLINLEGEITDSTAERELAYYSLYPEKVPDLVYIGSAYLNTVPYFEQAAEYEKETLDEGSVILYKSND